jgi:tetratricopeptide (TPR) repeat protein
MASHHNEASPSRCALEGAAFAPEPAFWRRADRTWRAAALVGALLPAAAAADATDSSGTVMLDPIFVDASTGTPWRYYSAPGYEIISHCPDSFNEAYTGALCKATAARLTLLPASFWGRLATPMKIVLYDREPEREDRLGLASPIDLGWVDGGRALPDTVMLSHPVTVSDGDTFINCGNYWGLKSDPGDLSADPDSALLLECRLPRLPAWFREGLEGPYGLFIDRVVASNPRGDTVVLRAATWISSDETGAIQEEAKRNAESGAKPRDRPMIPLADLFRHAIRGEPEALWASEAALLTRWGLYASGRREAFLGFVDEATREPATEAMFLRRMGMGYSEVLHSLEAYLPAAVGAPIRVPVTAERLEPFQARYAAPREVARILGDWCRMEGRNLGPEYVDFQRECLKQAELQFSKVVVRRADDPLLLAAYGLYAIQAGEGENARAVLEAATRAGVVRPRAYVELARLRLERALPSVQRGMGDLGEDDYAEILGILQTARQQMPALEGSYTLLARVLEHAPARPAGADVAVLDNALALFPQDAQLAYRVAMLHSRLGEPERASAIIGRAMGFSETEQARRLLSSFPGATGASTHP